MFIFIGTVNQIRLAYSRIFAKVAAEGVQVTDERAERYLYWESPESANNVVMIEIGVQDQAKP
jgi:effector-binding domain-containing protein